jgi:hypothetical protein
MLQEIEVQAESVEVLGAVYAGDDGEIGTRSVDCRWTKPEQWIFVVCRSQKLSPVEEAPRPRVSAQERTFATPYESVFKHRESEARHGFCYTQVFQRQVSASIKLYANCCTGNVSQ